MRASVICCPPGAEAVRLQLPVALRREEVYRYMGCPQDDPTAAALLDVCEPELLAAVQPRGTWRVLFRQDAPEGLYLDPGDVGRHLVGCDRVVLMAVTLGAGVERLLRRYTAADVALASAADAAGSVLAEQAADELERILREQFAQQGLYMTGRYSPGYGDWPIQVQRELCRILDTGRSIGLGVSENSLMAPRKSITAVLGVADHPVTGKLAGCGNCVLRDTCAYRKRGKTCADR
ncbi:MAG: methionine synthase [Oscillospiraceae bacterium]|nr:methionine synthase [Oscillospiraceae bacterium]